MATRTIFTDEVPEKTGSQYTTTLTKETGAALVAADLTTLTLTLYNLDAPLTILNACTSDNILNTGRGTVDSAGLLTLTLAPADNYLVDTSLYVEHHVALIQATYAAGAKASRHEIEFPVRNLWKVV